jgi:hypothetical protein
VRKSEQYARPRASTLQGQKSTWGISGELPTPG